MNPCLAELNMPHQKKPMPMGFDHEQLVELLWRNGEVVLHSQTHKKAGYECKHDASYGNQSNLIQDDAWLNCPIDEDLFLSESGNNKVEFDFDPLNVSPQSGFDPNPMPPPRFCNYGSVKEGSVMTVGSSHCGSNQVANDADTSRSAIAVMMTDHMGKVDRHTFEPSSSGGSGSSYARTCNQSTATNSQSHKRKSREGEEPECQSKAGELESAAGNKKSATTRRSRAAEVHNLSERRRRDRINEKMKALQELLPHSTKTDKASMLDEAIEYLKSLQMQLQMMWMGGGMASMMFPGVQHYIGMPPMHLAFVDPATPNQTSMLNPLHYQRHPNLVGYMGFNEPMNIFNLGGQTSNGNAPTN